MYNFLKKISLHTENKIIFANITLRIVVKRALISYNGLNRRVKNENI